MIFVDGENLTVRFENMRNTPDRVMRQDVLYDPGRFLWTERILANWPFTLIRISYYNTVVGDDKALEELRDKISSTPWAHAPSTGQLVPHIFKKAEKGEKNKSVDVNICVDVLRHTYGDNLDAVILLSGDGDYLPLIREVMRQGKQVCVSAFSSGLNPEIQRTVDRFVSLDSAFFKW